MKGVTLEKRPETEKKLTIRREGFHPFSALKHEVNRLFDEFFHHGDQLALTPWYEMASGFQARVDIKDNEDQIVVTAELPGVKLEDIDITVNADYLRIAGEKQEEKEEKERGRYRIERSYGSFMRQLPLPCAIEKDEVDASYNDGVLKIVLPKCKEALKEERRVTIKKG